MGECANCGTVSEDVFVSSKTRKAFCEDTASCTVRMAERLIRSFIITEHIVKTKTECLEAL